MLAYNACTREPELQHSKCPAYASCAHCTCSELLQTIELSYGTTIYACMYVLREICALKQTIRGILALTYKELFPFLTHHFILMVVKYNLL